MKLRSFYLWAFLMIALAPRAQGGILTAADLYGGGMSEFPQIDQTYAESGRSLSDSFWLAVVHPESVISTTAQTRDAAGAGVPSGPTERIPTSNSAIVHKRANDAPAVSFLEHSEFAFALPPPIVSEMFRPPRAS